MTGKGSSNEPSGAELGIGLTLACAALVLVGCTRCGAGLPENRTSAAGQLSASPSSVASAVVANEPPPPTPGPRSPKLGGGAACRGMASALSKPLEPNAAVVVRVKVESQGCEIAPDFVGSNFESFPDWGADVSMSEFQTTATVEAGLALLRYPGGTPGDWVDLLMTGPCSKGEPTNWGAPPYQSLWKFAKKAGVRSLMLQTNPTPQWCGHGPQDASGARAAALATDAASHGVDAVFEVGNEPDMPGGYFAKNGGVDAYTAKFIEHANAIHKARPGTEVYGPALCGLGGNCTFPVTWDSGYLQSFLKRTGDRATGPGKGSVDGISLHVYWHNEWGFSDFQEAKIDKYGFGLYWANTVMPYLREQIRKHDSRDLPIAISEISIGNGVSKEPGQAQNMFSVLATLDAVAAFAASGVRSFQWFDFNAAGPADFWLITPDRARPTYYAFVAWAKMGTKVIELSSSASLRDFSAYATKKADGSVQLLLINKTSTKHDVRVELDGYDPDGKRMEIVTLSPATSGSDAAKSVLFNGTLDPVPGKLPPPRASVVHGAALLHSLEPYSASVLSVAP